MRDHLSRVLACKSAYCAGFPVDAGVGRLAQEVREERCVVAGTAEDDLKQALGVPGEEPRPPQKRHVPLRVSSLTNEPVDGLTDDSLPSC